MRKDIKAINEAFLKVINEGLRTLRPGEFIKQLKSIIDTPDEKLTDVTNISIRLSDQREIFDRYPKIYPYVKEMFTAVMSENGAAKTKEIAKQAIAAVQKFYPSADKYQRANPKFSEDAEERSYEAVLKDVMALYQKGHITDASQAIDILTAELNRDLTPQEEQEVTGYFDGTDVYAKDAWSSEDAEDIKITPADPNASWNPRDWDNETDGAKSALDQIEDRLQYLSPEQLKELLSMVKDELADHSMSPVGYKPSPTFRREEDAEESNKELSDNKSMTVGEQAKHDKVFYAFWEDIVDRMSDDVLESTMYMIKEFNALNDLVKEEYAYRTQSFEA